MAVKKPSMFALLALLLLVVPSVALQKVPGDMDGDMKVSAEEVKKAEDAFSKGSITEQNLTEIKHIHEVYPITVTDTRGRTVTIYQPIKTVVCTLSHHLETLRTLKVPSSTVIGAPENIEIYSIFPEYSKLPTVGHFYEPNVEKIIELHPDLVLVHPGSGNGTFGAYIGPLLEKLDGAGLTVACFACSRPEIYSEEVEKLGKLFEHQEDAQKFIAFYNGFLGSIQERIKDLPDSQKPLVYGEYQRYRASTSDVSPIESAGGRSIFAGKGEIQEVNPEDVIAANPDVIIRIMGDEDYDRRDAGDTGKLEETRREIMSRPELQNITAVKEGRVYLIASPLWTYMPFSGCRHFIGLAYLAKWLHPDLFKDLDPRAVHQRYLNEFQGLDYDLGKRGTLVYPVS
jgi:iron complex transport system substrate-binding protein